MALPRHTGITKTYVSMPLSQNPRIQNKKYKNTKKEPPGLELTFEIRTKKMNKTHSPNTCKNQRMQIPEDADILIECEM